LRDDEAAAEAAGLAHLVNLNEDPFLDRKVKYSIMEGEPLICARRNKKSLAKMQLGGTGIE
jgi:hypothetical protein